MKSWRLCRPFTLVLLIAAGCGSPPGESSTDSDAGSQTGGGGGTTPATSTSSSGSTGGEGGSGATTTANTGGTGGSSATASGTAGTGGNAGGAGGTGTGGAGSGGTGGAGTGGMGGGGPLGDAALCPMPAMSDLFSGPFPPNPYDPAILSDSCAATVYDVVIVLGCPNDDDGTPSACQEKRADTAVALKDAGHASRFITTGAAVKNAYVEADTLKQLLVDRGVPAADIFTEPLAEHTDENIYYSTKIMEAQGWESALVVSDDPGHLVMTALCDSNCCVDLGRLTIVSMPVAGGSAVAGHYARYPWGAAVATAECDLIEQPLKFMCVNLATRKACKDNFQL